MWTALLIATPVWAACTFETTEEDLVTALNAAEAAYVTLDVPEFQRATAEVDFVVPCMNQPASAPVAAQLHRMRGLGYFIDDRRELALGSLGAARLTAPDYSFPVEVLPEGFELRTLYEGLPTAESERRRSPKLRGGELYFDGVATRDRPLGTATLFQRTDEQGLVQDSRYLSANDPLPPYPGANTRQSNLLLGAGLTSVAAATLYGLAWSSNLHLDQASDEADLNRRAGITNGLLLGSVGLALGAGTQVALALTVAKPK